MEKLKTIEICAGAGGQALGLERAGFDHQLLVEIDKEACSTLRLNRPHWSVIEQDVRTFNYEGVRIDLLAGGIPCPPFSIAGNQKGKDDERDLFPEMLRLAESIKPRAILIENVKGLLSNKFGRYRDHIEDQFEGLGYKGRWKLLYSSDYGVSQLRPRAAFVAFEKDLINYYNWPEKNPLTPPTVGQLLFDEMALLGWKGSIEWKENANKIAPTLVGGSKKHGGPDLGPSRARNEWKKLGVNGSSLADFPPDQEFIGLPRLTNKMAAMLQGFPDSWSFSGKKTNVYRQIGNAFPPSVAHAIGLKIKEAINRKCKNKWQHKRGKVLELNFENIS